MEILLMSPVNERKTKATVDVLVESKRQSGVKRRRLDIQIFYTLGEELGRGTFAVTWSCKHKVTGVTYACKSISKQGMTPQELEAVDREVDIMNRLSGEDNIIQLRDVCEDEDFVYLVMERCVGGELHDAMNARRKNHYSEHEVASLCRQVVKAIQTCHAAGVFHGDIKMENILFLTEETKGTSPIRLIDFGTSSLVVDEKSLEKVAGTPMCMAPEVWRQSYGKKADIWSLGVVLYALLCGAYPFEGENSYDLRDDILFGEIYFASGSWSTISDGAKDLVKKLLERDPAKRLAAEEILRHPWIQESVE